MGRGGQRPKERAECPDCHQQVAIHTWSGKLFAHDCGTPEERKARRAAARAAAKALLKGPCPECGHDLNRHACKSIIPAWQKTHMGCGAKVRIEASRRMRRCGCQTFQPEAVAPAEGTPEAL